MSDATLPAVDPPIGDDEETLRALIGAVHVELQTLARRVRRGFAPAPSLETVDLVGELYVRLFQGKRPDVRDREHFLCIAARTMRWILVSRHRRRRASEPLDDEELQLGDDASHRIDLLALDEALAELESKKPHLARVVEMNHFLGLQPKEIAVAVGRGERSVFRDLAAARSWLYWKLTGDGAHGDEAHGDAAHGDRAPGDDPA